MNLYCSFCHAWKVPQFIHFSSFIVYTAGTFTCIYSSTPNVGWLTNKVATVFVRAEKSLHKKALGSTKAPRLIKIDGVWWHVQERRAKTAEKLLKMFRTWNKLIMRIMFAERVCIIRSLSNTKCDIFSSFFSPRSALCLRPKERNCDKFVCLEHAFLN